MLFGRWVRRARLQEEVAGNLSGVVAATIDIYNSIRTELLPTPAKSHYTYNMRDLSKVFQVRASSSCSPCACCSHVHATHSACCVQYVSS
jgi:hypothetical protein